jgi:hypothetical protein
MFKCSLWTFIIIITQSSLGLTHEPHEGKILGTLGPYINQTQTDYTQGTYAPPQLGFGILAEGDLGLHGGLEIDLFYYQKIYQRVFANGVVVSKVGRLEVPIGYRYWLNSHFSGALTFSNAIAVGSPEIVTSNVSGDQSTSANSLSDYGFNLSVQWEFWSNDTFALLIDGRYTYSISTNPGEDANEFGGLLGLKYTVQEGPGNQN